MSDMETLSLRIFGRDLTLACPPEEKDQLIEASKLLNNELDSINDKNNALIIAGLSLANSRKTARDLLLFHRCPIKFYNHL